MTFIETAELKNFKKDPEKFYVKACGGIIEFNSLQEYETWNNQK